MPHSRLLLYRTAGSHLEEQPAGTPRESSRSAGRRRSLPQVARLAAIVPNSAFSAKKAPYSLGVPAREKLLYRSRYRLF